LRRLRYPSKTRPLWIDAICINQQDRDERASQVMLMRRIYEQADRVCIWLGERTESSQLAIDDLRSPVGSEFNPFSSSTTSFVSLKLISPSTFHRNISSVSTQQFAALMDELEQGELRELLCRPWWTRMWIMQEAIVAPKLILMCGSETFSWDGIQRSINRRRNRGGVEVFGIIANQEIASMQDETYQTISRFRDSWRKGNREVSIYELLYHFRHLSCADNRDRVFAVLGLASADGQRLGITPDYTASVNDVFVGTARSIIRATGSLDILNCKREWAGIARPSRPACAYTLTDQAKYHDVAAMVSNGPDDRPRKGWARLPPGWERIEAETPGFWAWSKWKAVIDGSATNYYNHNTGTLHETSPLARLPPSAPQHVANQRVLPAGWIKDWDNVGRARIRYAPDHHPTPSVPTTSPIGFNHPLSLPTWVPNWAAPTAYDPSPLLNWSSPGATRFNAAGRFTAAVTDLGQPYSPMLGIQGLQFDIIIRLASPWHPTSPSPPLTRDLASPSPLALQSWETLALDTATLTLPCPYDGLPNGRRTAFWRTHIADYLPPVPSDHGEAEERAPADGWSMMECWYDRTKWGKRLPSPEEMAQMGIVATIKARAGVQSLDSALYDELRDLGEEDVSIFKCGDRYGQYLRRIHEVGGHRALFVTSKGHIGLAPWNAMVGDQVCILSGGKTPFLLRRDEEATSKRHYSLVGEAYVCGIMDGEGVRDLAEEDMEMFYLV